MNSNPAPETPIREVFGAGRWAKCCCLRVDLFLQRRATVADLPDIDPDKFEDWLRLQYADATVATYMEILRAALRRLALIPKRIAVCPERGRPGSGNSRPPRPLSDATGTLWQICRDDYFPVNVRIRSEQTRKHYRTCIADLKAIVGHDPTPADLTDDNIARVMTATLDRGLSRAYANQRRGRLRALWEWLARKHRTEHFPTIPKLKEPKRIPKAWTLDQLGSIMAACRREPGRIDGIAAADWWTALHLVAWDSAERISALLALRWSMLDGATLLVPAEVRKGCEADASYMLSPETLAALERLRPAGHDRIFAWPFTSATVYSRLKRIYRRAGLPTDRKSMMHRMRKSVASHLTRLGHDACAALGHSSPAVTAVYLDPSITGAVVKPAAVLPRIGGVA